MTLNNDESKFETAIRNWYHSPKTIKALSATALANITAFSSKPLAIASFMGILLFLAALVFIAFIIIRRIVWGDPVDVWASTACIILFCSGTQLFAIGILGQYLSKTYTEVK